MTVTACHIRMPCAVYNPDYIKWVNESIHDIQYERQPGVIEVGWNDLAKKAASAEPVVVMVTQATVSRYSSHHPICSHLNPCNRLDEFQRLYQSMAH